MMRRFGTALLLTLAPSAAMAESALPQMDFSNPLTWAQLGWMVAILVVLYFILARWGLPEVRKVIENRAAVIARNLAAARAAKQEADEAMAQLSATLAAARADARAQLAKAMADAKAEASAQSASLNAQLDAKIAESEARIEAARAAAVAAIKPVATEATDEILQKLVGARAGQGQVVNYVDAVLAARKVA